MDEMMREEAEAMVQDIIRQVIVERVESEVENLTEVRIRVTPQGNEIWLAHKDEQRESAELLVRVEPGETEKVGSYCRLIVETLRANRKLR